MKKSLILAIIFSTSSFASTSACHKILPALLSDYAKNQIIISSTQVKTCSLSNEASGPVFNEDMNTNAPIPRTSNACVVILELAQRAGLKELAIIDEVNSFKLVRSFANKENEDYSMSLLGKESTGIISYIKSEGKGRDNYGFLKRVRFITRADLNQKNGLMRLQSWRLGLFSNDYSHDYLVDCK